MAGSNLRRELTNLPNLVTMSSSIRPTPMHSAASAMLNAGHSCPWYFQTMKSVTFPYITRSARLPIAPPPTRPSAMCRRVFSTGVLRR